MISTKVEDILNNNPKRVVLVRHKTTGDFHFGEIRKNPKTNDNKNPRKRLFPAAQAVQVIPEAMPLNVSEIFQFTFTEDSGITDIFPNSLIHEKMTTKKPSRAKEQANRIDSFVESISMLQAECVFQPSGLEWMYIKGRDENDNPIAVSRGDKKSLKNPNEDPLHDYWLGVLDEKIFDKFKGGESRESGSLSSQPNEEKEKEDGDKIETEKEGSSLCKNTRYIVMGMKTQIDTEGRLINLLPEGKFGFPPPPTPLDH